MYEFLHTYKQELVFLQNNIFGLISLKLLGCNFRKSGSIVNLWLKLYIEQLILNLTCSFIMSNTISQV